MPRRDNDRGLQHEGRARLPVAVLSLFAVVFCLPFFCRAEMEAPALTNLRYDEDYSYLRNPEAHSGQWWEPLKFLPLTERSYLTLGSELRLRFESITNDNWGLGKDDGYLWFRSLPYADLHAFDSLRLFGQFIIAEAVDREPVTPLDQDRADVLQLFGDLIIPAQTDGNLTLRVGRQLLIYGSGRLVDVRYGPNVLRPFDAARLVFETGPWRCDAFYSRPVALDVDSFDDKINETASFSGVYLTRDLTEILALPGNGSAGIDAYYFVLDREGAVFKAKIGDELRHTLGVRFFGAAENWDWDFEGFYQFGEFASGDILAWSFASSSGYTFRDLPFSPRTGLKVNFISGDENPDDGDIGTFNPLFPKGKYFGELTPLGPENLINIQPSLTLGLTDKLQLLFSTVLYWRYSADDAIYDLGGSIVRPAGASKAYFIGTEWEAVVSYKFTRTLEGSVSYSQFHAGEFIQQTGPDRTMRFVGAELLFKF